MVRSSSSAGRPGRDRRPGLLGGRRRSRRDQPHGPQLDLAGRRRRAQAHVGGGQVGCWRPGGQGADRAGRASSVPLQRAERPRRGIVPRRSAASSAGGRARPYRPSRSPAAGQVTLATSSRLRAPKTAACGPLGPVAVAVEVAAGCGSGTARSMRGASRSKVSKRSFSSGKRVLVARGSRPVPVIQKSPLADTQLLLAQGGQVAEDADEQRRPVDELRRNSGASVSSTSRHVGGHGRRRSGSGSALTLTSSTKSLTARRTGRRRASKTTMAFSPCGEKTVP